MVERFGSGIYIALAVTHIVYYNSEHIDTKTNTHMQCIANPLLVTYVHTYMKLFAT